MSEKTYTIANIAKNEVGPVVINYVDPLALQRTKHKTVEVFKGTPLRNIPEYVVNSEECQNAISAKRLKVVLSKKKKSESSQTPVMSEDVQPGSDTGNEQAQAKKGAVPQSKKSGGKKQKK